MEKVAADLRKAADEDEPDIQAIAKSINSSIFNPTQMQQAIIQYGSAVVAAEKSRFDKAIEEGFDAVFQDMLPSFSDEQAGELEKILETARRMEGDPNQAAAAPNYFVSSLIKFVAERGVDHGAEQERKRLESRKTLTDKIAGSNAIAAAKAKLERERAPPASPKSVPTGDDATPSLETYNRLKKEGRYAEAQQVVDEMARLGVR